MIRKARRIHLAKVTYDVLVCKVTLFTNAQSFTHRLVSMHFCFSIYDHLRKLKSLLVKFTLPYCTTAAKWGHYKPRAKSAVDNMLSLPHPQMPTFCKPFPKQVLGFGPHSLRRRSKIMRGCFWAKWGINSRAEGPSRDLWRDKSNQKAVTLHTSGQEAGQALFAMVGFCPQWRAETVQEDVWRCDTYTKKKALR